MLKHEIKKTNTAAIFKAERPSRKQQQYSLKRKLYSIANLTLTDVEDIVLSISHE